MELLRNEIKETYTLDDKEYTVITRVSNNSLGKDKLVKLIAGYAMQELRQEDL